MATRPHDQHCRGMQMINWFTLCDINYAPRALCLLRSMERWATYPFKLIVICCDQETYRVFDREEYVRAIQLSWIEEQHKRLLNIKHSRSWVEYLWTLPSVICSLFYNGRTPVIYLDADLYFFYGFDNRLSEFGFPFDEHTLIIPHRWTPKYEERLKVNGIYNVSMVAFGPQQRAGYCAELWAHQCLTWCYNRLEDGKFGDQKYLDIWPERWGAHVVDNPGWGLAPWNQEQYRYRMLDAVAPEGPKKSLLWWRDKDPEMWTHMIKIPAIDMGDKLYLPVTFYHFHELKTRKEKVVKYTNYPVHPFVEQNIYGLYEEEYASAYTTVCNRLSGTLGAKLPGEGPRQPFYS